MAYRVMIVDDEKYICRFIENRTNWKQLCAEPVGNARNGVEALELMEREKPDIVLTDIRMPKMDGLDFIREAQRRYPQTKFIVMSAYSDFTYAQQSMRLGVADYLLKPIDLKELEMLLGEILHEKREKLLEGLVKNKGECDPSVFWGKRILALGFCIEEEDLGKQTEGSLRSILEGLPGRTDVFCPQIAWSRDCMVFLLNGNHLEEIPLRQMIEEVWKSQPGMRTVASVSSIMKCAQADIAVRDAVDRMKKRVFYKGKALIFDESGDREDSNRIQVELQSEMVRIYRDILNGEFGYGSTILQQLVERYISKKNSVELMERWIQDLLQFLENLQDIKVEKTDFLILTHRLKGENCLLRYQSEEKLKEDLLVLIDRTLGERELLEENRTITQIKGYIQHNFKQDLSVQKIAKIFYLNTNYLSTLFKEKTGITLKSYMEGVRMEKAKEYLAKADRSVTEIAQETGYSDSNYFSKVFKKYMGITPKQFREMRVWEE